MSVVSELYGSRGQECLWVRSPLYSQHLELSMTHSGSQGNGSKLGSVFISTLCEIFIIVHYCFIIFPSRLLYSFILSLPPIWPYHPHDPWQQWRKYLLNTYEVRWFTFIFVLILKFSKSCKLSIVTFHFTAGKLD